MATTYCNQCGNPNPEGSKFCSSCGHRLTVLQSNPATSPPSVRPTETQQPQPAISKPKTPVNAAESLSPSACPVCKREDQTAKVSAIVRMQTSSGRQVAYDHRNDSSYSVSSNSQTALARALERPNPPFPSTELAILMSCAGIIGAVVFIVPLGLLMLTDPPIICAVPIVLAILSLIWMAFAAIRTIFGKKEMTEEQMNQTLAWEEAMRRWETAYYCARCDETFFNRDGQKPHTSLQEFRTRLLYGNLKQKRG